MQTLFFLLRRVFLAGSIVYGGEFPFLQAFLNIGISIAILIYLILVKPFLSRNSIKYEVYNEVTVLILSYLQIPLLDIVTNVEIRYAIGWLMVALTLTNIVVNFGSLLWSVLVFIYHKIQKCRNKSVKKDAQNSYITSQD